MFYREYAPPPALADHIQRFWALEHDYRDPFHTHEHGLMPDFAELKPSIVFMCADIDTFCAGLKAKGVKFEKELMNLGWGKFASFLDEDGNKYGLKG